MKYIYYFFIIIPILLELYYLVEPFKAKELVKSLAKDSTQPYNSTDCFLMTLELFNMIWITIGLLTFQWYSYAALLLTTGLFYMINKKFDYPILSLTLNSMITLGLLFFIFYNAFFLQFKLHL